MDSVADSHVVCLAPSPSALLARAFGFRWLYSGPQQAAGAWSQGCPLRGHLPALDRGAQGAEAADPSDLRFPWEVIEPDARAADQIDDRPAAEAAVVDADGAGGSMGGAGGAGSDAGVDGAGSGGASSTGGSGFDGAAIIVDSGDGVADVTVDLPPDYAGDSSVDVALDVPRDVPSPDSVVGTITCPTTILGSLDSGDSVQLGRLSRIG